MSWIFYCGVLACCISGFVTANRFGFSLYGAQCAYERIYYDSKFGQLKKEQPRLEGISKEANKVGNLNKIFDKENKIFIPNEENEEKDFSTVFYEYEEIKERIDIDEDILNKAKIYFELPVSKLLIR